MTDETQTEAAAPAAAATPTPEAQAIAAAVEASLAAERTAAALTPAAKQTAAHGIYTAWRNANLGGLTPQAFALVEASSAALITAIAAQL